MLGRIWKWILSSFFIFCDQLRSDYVENFKIVRVDKIVVVHFKFLFSADIGLYCSLYGIRQSTQCISNTSDLSLNIESLYPGFYTVDYL